MSACTVNGLRDAPLIAILTRAMNLTAIFQKVSEGYIAFVEELPGANAQGRTLEEARENLREAVEMVIEANRQLSEQFIQGKSVIREPFKPAA